MKNKNVPEIRFPEFTDDWELRKLGEVTESFDGKRVPIDSGLRVSGEYPYYGATGIIDYVDDYIFDGEYVLLAEDGANIIMRNYPVAYLTQGKFWLNNHAHIMRMIDGSNYFLVQVLEKIDYKKYNTGTAQPKLNSKIVKNIEFKLPHIEEQQQIGTFFKQLDDTIALHQRKLKRLKQTKQGFFQKMFLKDGEKVPEVRFPGFTDDWELRKLSELATMNARIGWQNLRTSEFLDSGDYMLITGTDFKDGKIDYSNIHYVEKERYDQDKKIQIKNDSILITKDGTLGKVAFVEGLTMPATLNAGVFNVRVKESDVVDSQYLFHYLKAPFLLKYADAQSTGGTIKHLNQNVLVNFPIPLPIIEEQKKIGNFLKQLDDTIALYQHELDILKETKKGFLQKLFV